MSRLEYYREYRKRNREKLAENSRRYYERDPERQHARVAAWRASNQEKSYAHMAISNELRRGRMAPEPCLFCDDPSTDAHHHDYSLPLVVTWLCREHHKLAHMEG